MGIVFWGLRMGRGVVSDPQKKFQPDRPSIFLLLDPRVDDFDPKSGLFWPFICSGGSGEGSEGCFLGRFRAFSGVFGGLSCEKPQGIHNNVTRGYWECSERVLWVSGCRFVVFLSQWAWILGPGSQLEAYLRGVLGPYLGDNRRFTIFFFSKITQHPSKIL